MVARNQRRTVGEAGRPTSATSSTSWSASARRSPTAPRLAHPEAARHRTRPSASASGASAGSGNGEPGMEGERHQLAAVVGAELEHRAADVGFRCGGADDEPLGDVGLLRPSATSATTSRSRGVSSSRSLELGSWRVGNGGELGDQPVPGSATAARRRGPEARPPVRARPARFLNHRDAWVGAHPAGGLDAVQPRQRPYRGARHRAQPARLRDRFLPGERLAERLPISGCSCGWTGRLPAAMNR